MMKRWGRYIGILLLLVMIMVTFREAEAAGGTAAYRDFENTWIQGDYDAAVMGQRVYDQSGVFQDDHEEWLEIMAYNISEATGMDIGIVTTDDAEGRTTTEYADDFYDYNDFGSGKKHSGFLLLIDFDNREYGISTSGDAIYYLTDDRIEDIMNVMEDSMAEGYYYTASVEFLKESFEWIEAGVPEDQYTYDEETGEIIKYKAPVTFMDILAVLLVAAGAGALFYWIVQLRYKKKVKPYKYPYREKSTFRLTGQDDMFVNKNVTTRRIPQHTSSGGGSAGGAGRSSGSSGRSTVHRSSSGRSHGGGSRKF